MPGDELELHRIGVPTLKPSALFPWLELQKSGTKIVPSLQPFKSPGLIFTALCIFENVMSLRPRGLQADIRSAGQDTDRFRRNGQLCCLPKF